MKKRVVSFVMAVLMLFGTTTAMAAEVEDGLRASYYLSTYSVALGARDNHRMAITVDVNGTGVMDKIGISVLCIDQKIDGEWYEFDTLYGYEHPDYYEYDSLDYFNTLYFTGEAGVQYRVTVTVFAQNSTGHDTGDVTSYTVTCK